jgi:hypothetical protein
MFVLSETQYNFRRIPVSSTISYFGNRKKSKPYYVNNLGKGDPCRNMEIGQHVGTAAGTCGMNFTRLAERKLHFAMQKTLLIAFGLVHSQISAALVGLVPLFPKKR